MDFVQCEVPKEFRIRTYGENQKLVTAFADSGFRCAKVTNFNGDIRSLPSRLTKVAKDLNMPHVKVSRVGNDVYLLNTLIKEA